MATRSGSVDPGLLLWVQRHGEIDAEEMERALDRDSGLLALSGPSGDMREVIASADAATTPAASPSTSTSFPSARWAPW
jgi:acetate kinase